MITYRLAHNSDLIDLCNLDLKCYEQPPATQEWWMQIFESPQFGCIVACKNQVPIGMIVWGREAFKLPNFKAKVTTLHIHKICVYKEFRKKSIGKHLLAHVHEKAQREGIPYMTMCVPEYKCEPGTPDDISGWLNKLGFKATIILPLKVPLYGKDYDQFLFVYEVKV
jgi:ribosomal protein S18 acetylase RimI-like enzyme